MVLNVPPLRTVFGVPIPIQSVLQVLSAVAAAAVGAAMALGLIHWLSDGLDPGGIAMILAGAVMGAVPSVYVTRPSTLTIRTAPQGERYWRQQVHGQLERYGYHLIETVTGQGTRYRTRLPRLLRWSENEIVVKSAHDAGMEALVATGPSLINTIVLNALRPPAS